VTNSTLVAGKVVEFAGLPGAGKSTVAESTRAALAAAGVPCTVADAGISARVPPGVRVRRRLALAGVDMSLHPVRGVQVLRAAHQVAPAWRRDAVAGATQWFAVQRLIARSRSTSGVHLLEEGPLQTLWTLLLRTGSDPRPVVQRMLQRRSLASPDLLVLVDAPVELASERLCNRASRHSRTQQLPEPEQLAELEAGRGLLQAILAVADRPHLLLSNDGSTTLDELGRRTATWLLRGLR
jgi:hypothetical protein